MLHNCSFYELIGALASEYNNLQSENASLRGLVAELRGYDRNKFATTITVVEIDTLSVELVDQAPAQMQCRGATNHCAPLQQDASSTDLTELPRDSSQHSTEKQVEKTCLSEPQQKPQLASKWFLASSRDLPNLPPKVSQPVGSVSSNSPSQTPKFKPTPHSVWRTTIAKEQIVPRMMRGASMQKLTSAVTAVSRGGDTLKDEGLCRHMVISPNSPFRMFWDLSSLVILLFDIVMVPLVVFELPPDTTMENINFTCIMFWTVDLGVSSISGYHKAGAIEMRIRNVIRHYSRTWLCFDILVVSLDWFMLLMGADFSEVIGFFRIFRISRFARVLRLFRLLRILKMPTMLEDLMNSCRTDFLVTVIAVFKSLIIIAGVNHFVACGWYAVGQWSDGPSWIDRLDGDTVDRDFKFRYVTSLHWSLTQFTPASMEIFPRSFPERLYAITVLFLALVVFSSFVSSITNAMNHLRQINEEAHKQQENLRRFIHDNKLSLELGFRIQAFARHHHAVGRLRVHWDDISTFKILPEALRLQAHWEVHVPVLVWLPVLYTTVEVYESFVLDLCNTAIEEISILQGQEVFTAGIEAKAMHFVLSGYLEYYFGADDCESADVQGEQWVCEVALWLHWLYQGRLSVVKQSELLALHGSTFRKLASHIPELHGALKNYAQAYNDYVQCEIEMEYQKVWFDVMYDHDSSLEMAQRAFDSCPEAGRSLPLPHRKSWRPWHTFSLMRELSQNLSMTRTSTA